METPLTRHTNRLSTTSSWPHNTTCTTWSMQCKIPEYKRRVSGGGVDARITNTEFAGPGDGGVRRGGPLTRYLDDQLDFGHVHIVRGAVLLLLRLLLVILGRHFAKQAATARSLVIQFSRSGNPNWRTQHSESYRLLPQTQHWSLAIFLAIQD